MNFHTIGDNLHYRIVIAARSLMLKPAVTTQRIVPL